MTNFSVLFDGPSGEKASAEDGCTLGCSLGLGEEESHLLQKFLDIIRANPVKAESLYGKFQKIVEEEQRSKDQYRSGANLMRVRQPPSMRSKRAAEKRRKMGKKKKQISKQKKVEKAERDRQVNSKKGKTVKSKEKKVSEKRQKGKRITNKNNSKLKKKKKKKLKMISGMKYYKQKRIKAQRNEQKNRFLEKSEELQNCTSLWAELTNVGFRLASTLKKQVIMNIVLKS